jgi:excinuclease ABC subunit A
LDIVKSADWVIDMGPEGGDKGGKIIATGTPEQIARNPQSHTGRFLARVLNGNGQAKRNGNDASKPAAVATPVVKNTVPFPRES